MIPKMFTGVAARPSWDVTNRPFTFEHRHDGTQKDQITLFVSPESFTQSEPSRITVTQTKGGAFVDNFGAGLKTIVIQGITGYKPKPVPSPGLGAGTVSGHEHFIQLRQMYRDWVEGAKDDPSDILKFYNWADDEAWQVVITQFTLQRAVGRPLLYQYNIQMTCIADLSQLSTVIPDNVTDMLMDPIARVGAILNNLNNNVDFLNNILAGGYLDPSVSGWAAAVVGGMEVFNTITETYQSVGSILVQASDLISNVEMFVKGSTNFIIQPFEMVQNLATGLDAVIEQACHITDVPHIVIRALRNMICSIIALPQSLFIGFTNPSLFEGASNCGTTLGIPPALVADFSNSFSATAQLPPQRQVTQIFRSPQVNLKLNEVPLKVTGVFLETDVSRIGINYLASWAGDTVKLTNIPIATVVVDYAVQQVTAQSMLQLQTSSAYILKSGDTPIRVALNAYGDPSKWKELILYNDLEYPFFVEDRNEFQKEIFATGMVRFIRDLSGNPGDVITIPKGYAVYAPAYRGTYQINFETTQTVVLGAMKSYVDVPIIALEIGEIGNVASGVITGCDTFVTIEDQGVILPGIAGVLNTQPTIGGKIWKVAFVGDTIQIPKTSAKQSASAVVSSTIDYAELLGIDIWVDEFGEFDSSVEEATDFARVVGVPNLVQALKNRIYTTKGFYPYHSEYGTDLPFYIGKKGGLNNYDTIKFDIKGSVLLDPRISSIKSFQMGIDGDTVSMEFDAVPIGDMPSLPLNIIV